MNRDEIRRFMPENCEPMLKYLPDEFFNLYATLIIVMFWGDAKDEVPRSGGRRRKAVGSYHFANEYLLGTKDRPGLKRKIDGFLSQTAQAIERWEKEGGGDPEGGRAEADELPAGEADGEGPPAGGPGEPSEEEG